MSIEVPDDPYLGLVESPEYRRLHPMSRKSARLTVKAVTDAIRAEHAKDHSHTHTAISKVVDTLEAQGDVGLLDFAQALCAKSLVVGAMALDRQAELIKEAGPQQMNALKGIVDQAFGLYQRGVELERRRNGEDEDQDARATADALVSLLGSVGLELRFKGDGDAEIVEVGEVGLTQGDEG